MAGFEITKEQFQTLAGMPLGAMFELRKMGYQNFWFSYNSNENIDEYIEKIEKLVDLQ